MRRLPFRNMMLWLTILTLLWSSQGYGYVWCMTEEGTHLESVGGSHCVQNDSVAESCSATFTADASSRAHCFDLATTADTLQHRTLTSADLDSLFLLAANVPPQWISHPLVRHLDNNLILEPPRRVATTLLVHRTIVLLI